MKFFLLAALALPACSGAVFTVEEQQEETSPPEASTIVTPEASVPESAPAEAGSSFPPTDADAGALSEAEAEAAAEANPEPSVEASAPEASAPEATPVCSPAKTKITDACPLAGDGQLRAAYQNVMVTAPSPWYVMVVPSSMYFPPPDGCIKDPTAPTCPEGSCEVYDLQIAPPECQCAETFNCACLWSAPGLFTHYACEMIDGQPVVSRNTAGAPDGSLP